MKKSPTEVLQEAKSAALTKAAEIWDRDEHQDRGSCGDAVLMLKGGRKLTKAAISLGYASGGSDIFVKTFIPDGVHSHNADIYQASARAFRDVLVAEGYGTDIKKFWTYVD